MRPDYLRRFLDAADELRRRPDVAVARVFVAPPVPDATIARVHRELGFALSDRILAFYRQANGLALEWVPTEHPAYDPKHDATERDAPFDMVPQQVPGGVMNILPLEALLADHEDELWFAWMAGQQTELNGSRYDLLAFSRAIRPFDGFSEESMAAFFLADHVPDPPVLLGDDHGASFTAFPATTFEAYMEGTLALRGSWVGRRRFFCHEDRPPGTAEAWREIAPSLDELVRWSLEHARQADVDATPDDFAAGDLDDFDPEDDLGFDGDERD